MFHIAYIKFTTNLGETFENGDPTDGDDKDSGEMIFDHESHQLLGAYAKLKTDKLGTHLLSLAFIANNCLVEGHHVFNMFSVDGVSSVTSG